MLKLLLAVMVSCLLSVLALVPLTALPGETLTLTPAPDVCSENPYYAEAIAAMDWMATHPSAFSQSAQAYSHAVLDSTYQSLLEQGLVDPVPPPCIITAQTETIVQSAPGAISDPIAVMLPGETADVYGRSEDGAWWNILSSAGWGWVSTATTVLQDGAEFDLIPYH